MNNFFKDRLTNRQADIIVYLIENQNNGFLPLNEIGEKFNLSSKTIYREIKEIKSKANPDKISIKSKEGSGVKIECKNSDDLRVRLLNIKIPDKQTRMVDILVDLLKISPKKLTYEELGDRYYVSATSIAKDIKTMEDEIKKFIG